MVGQPRCSSRTPRSPTRCGVPACLGIPTPITNDSHPTLPSLGVARWHHVRVPFHVVLHEPQIAGNTGNIIRLCANTGAQLHLVAPLGFELDDARLRRAGLDYREFAHVRTHQSLGECLDTLGQPRVFAFTARATRTFETVQFTAGDALLFGPESDGLDSAVLATIDDARHVRIPMRSSSRSLNLSNAVAVAVYEGLRQLRYPLD
ncbi:MAG: putative tRNA ((34)-2-O)-methyltransferase [Actinomycetota bacterium]|nr:putative tRNA ((34)-2-O)-methyltransferase [Actinomycetota bacterium]